MERDDLRVLVLGVWFPFPPRWGWAVRVYHLARQIARRHDVTLLTYGTGADQPNVARLREEGIHAETVLRERPSKAARRRDQLVSLVSRLPFESYIARSAELQQAIDRLSAERPFDVIQLESTLVWPFRFPRESKLVLDEHNIEYENYARHQELEGFSVRKAFYAFEAAKVRRYEQAAWREVAGCVLTSAREEEIVRAHAPDTPTVVVPNGVDVDYFRPGEEEREAASIVFNGVLDYRPNLDAALFLVDEVLPLVRAKRPEARVTIVGRRDSAELERVRGENVEATGEVPDVRPYLQKAAVVAVPIRAGSGTRFKVVEGLAVSAPMVSTAVGCEGIGVRDGEHLRVADSAEDFAAAILELVDDPELGRRLGAAGRRFVEAEYSWEAAGERLETLYERIR
jgi:glycosyltransferase involved in cell wall biosynthesis